MWNVHESVLSKTTEKHADLLSSRGHAAPEGERENGSHFHSSEVVCRPRKHLNSFPLLIFPFAERKLLNLASSLGSRWVCANWLWKWCKFGIWMFKGCCFFRSYQTHKKNPKKQMKFRFKAPGLCSISAVLLLVSLNRHTHTAGHLSSNKKQWPDCKESAWVL